MTVTITIDAPDAESARAQMRQLLAITLQTGISAPAVSDVSSDNEGGLVADYRATPVVIGEGTPAPTPTKRRGRPVKLPEGPALNVVANISTGDERVDPESSTDREHGFADLHAPVEQPAQEVKTLTLDDVRNAAKPYIDKWTIAAAQSDLQDVLEAAAGVRAISKLNPTDQAQLKKAVGAFEAASKAEARFVKAA